MKFPPLQIPFKITFVQAFTVLSLVLITFCLGIGWAVIKPGPVPETPLTSRFHTRSEPLPTTAPSRDVFLVYPRRSEVLFWNDSMEIQSNPFRFFQIATTDRVEDVLKWYGESWSGRDLLVKGRGGDGQGRLEALDYNGRRFLNVHVKWNEALKRTEIMATAIAIPEKQPRYLRDQKNNSWVTTGKTADGGSWSRKTEIQRLPLQQARTRMVHQMMEQGFEMITESSIGGQVWLAFHNRERGVERFITLSPHRKISGTVMQEMTIHAPILPY